MARVKLSAIIVGITGRYGGSVFRPWKGLTVLSALQTQVHNPDTPLQKQYRTCLSFVSKQWHKLTVAVKDQWGTVAAYLTEQWDPGENPVGFAGPITTPRGPFTPLGAVVAIHSLLRSIGTWAPGDALVTPPVGLVAPTAPENLAGSGDNTGIILTWAAPTNWGGTAGKVRIWARTEDNRAYPQLLAVVPGATLTYTITGLRTTGGAGNTITLAKLISGQLLVCLDAVCAEGYRSAPSNVLQIRFDPAP
jgi:hypothetical protein